MDVLLIEKNKQTQQTVLVSTIQNVYQFLDEISKFIIKELENESYCYIIFKHKNKYNNNVKAKLGYISIDEEGNKKIFTTCDENYLNYYINQMNSDTLSIEYKINIGKPNDYKIEYNYPNTRATDEYTLKGVLKLKPETRISDGFGVYNRDYFKLKSIKFFDLGENEKTINLNDEKIDMPLSELVKKYNIDDSKNISFYWESNID